MVKFFFNMIIPLAAAVTLLLILVGEIEKKMGNGIFALLFGIFIIYFGYKGYKEMTMLDYVAIFYIVIGTALVIVNSWFLWGIL